MFLPTKCARALKPSGRASRPVPSSLITNPPTGGSYLHQNGFFLFIYSQALRSSFYFASLTIERLTKEAMLLAKTHTLCSELLKSADFNEKSFIFVRNLQSSGILTSNYSRKNCSRKTFLHTLMIRIPAHILLPIERRQKPRTTNIPICHKIPQHGVSCRDNRPPYGNVLPGIGAFVPPHPLKVGHA
jgi:hypothetical protein